MSPSALASYPMSHYPLHLKLGRLVLEQYGLGRLEPEVSTPVKSSEQLHVEHRVHSPAGWQLQTVCLGPNPLGDSEGAQPSLPQLPPSRLPKVGRRQKYVVPHRMLHRPPPAVMGGLLPPLDASQ